MLRPDLSRILVLLVGVLVLFLVFVVVSPYLPEEVWPRNGQIRRVKLATEFIAAHASAIHADPRFSDVQVAPFQGRGGCIFVYGSVPSETDRRDLKQIINAKIPPVEVWFNVTTTAP